MARTRSFDEDKVLTGAMHAFRKDGYAGVSIKQLEQSTGLTSGSLYNAYGDKDGLYRAAFAHYVGSFVKPRMDAYTGPDATLDDLERFFLSLFQMPFADGQGCLITNALIEFGSGASIASEFVGQGLDLLKNGMAPVLAREIGPAAADLATMRLVLLYQGMLVLSRAGRIGTEVEDVVKAEFNRLRAERM